MDAAGVSEAEISTQGVNNIVVSLPGTPDEATLQRIQASAKLDFRAGDLLTTGATAATASPSATPTDGVDAESQRPRCRTRPTAKPTNGSDLSYVTPFLQNKYDTLRLLDARLGRHEPRARRQAARDLRRLRRGRSTCSARSRFPAN